MGAALAAIAVFGITFGAYVSLSDGTAPRSASSDAPVSPPWTPPQPTIPLAGGMPEASAPSATTPASPARKTVRHSRATTRTNPRPAATSPARSPSPSPTSDGSRRKGFGSIVNPIDKCVDVAAGGTSDGDPVQQWSCHGGDNQLWAFVPGDAGHYVIVNRNSRKCLDVYGGDHGDGARVQQWSCHGGANQQWRLEAGGGYYRLINRNSGRCLDVHGFDHNDGARVQQWSCNGGVNQDFRLR